MANVRGKIKKQNIIIALVVWILLVLFIVAPFAVAIDKSTVGEDFSIGMFMKVLPEVMNNPLDNIFLAFSESIHILGSAVFVVSLVYVSAITYILVKISSRSEYSNVEHGSSAWCEGG